MNPRSRYFSWIFGHAVYSGLVRPHLLATLSCSRGACRGETDGKVGGDALRCRRTTTVTCPRHLDSGVMTPSMSGISKSKMDVGLASESAMMADDVASSRSGVCVVALALFAPATSPPTTPN